MDQANTEMYTEHQHHEAMMGHDEHSAPLAQADVNTMQGLTLDDLTRMHHESEGHSEASEHDASTENHAYDHQEQVQDQDASHEAHYVSADSTEAYVETVEREISDQVAESEAPTSSESESVETKPDLAQSLRLELEEDSYHLAQLDDLTRFAQDAKQLFEARLPDIMSKLSKTLHAHEQLNHLYGQLAQLSSQRETASVIMQTARQIESMEAILANEQAPDQDVQQAYQDVQRMQRILSAYENVLSQIQQA